MKKMSCGKAGLLRQMEKISVGMSAKGWRLLNPVAKKQRTIMEAMGLHEDDLRARIDGKLMLDL